ncbi:MAG: molybdopterin molybdenumtransferase MoeA, partial [Flammeovirgaceae bacterium]
MVSVEEATSIIQSNLLKTSTVEVSFTQAVGRVLSEPILADRDWPPFDRATMDGIAVAHKALTSRSAFTIQSTQPAGEPQQILFHPNDCIEIMTGAALPQQTDTIIPYEQITIKNKIATIDPHAIIEKGQNIHRQGTDAQKGHVILNTGIKLSPTEIAVLAAVGKNSVN